MIGIAFAADPPQAEISNGQIRAKLYLPDAKDGFYRSTRFDWSGALLSLDYAGHNFYGPWFTKYDPSVRDFTYKDTDIIVGAASAMVGPVEEFQRPIGFDTAKAGGTFLKVGVGILRRADETNYAAMRPYEIVDSGKWTIRKGNNFVEFTQELADVGSGYGYVYRKTIRLTDGKPEMTIDHSLKNTGSQPIQTSVYNHNFLVLDGLPPGPDYSITVPFEIKTTRPPNPEFAEVQGKQIAYKKVLVNQDRVAIPIEGFSSEPKDYDIRIENRKAEVGMRITCDRQLARASLWSIRSVLAVEPFLDIAAEPGKEFTWKYTYTYYTLGKAR